MITVKLDTSWLMPSVYGELYYGNNERSKPCYLKLRLSSDKDPLTHETKKTTMENTHKIGLPYLLAIVQTNLEKSGPQMRAYDGLALSALKHNKDPATNGKIENIAWYLLERQKPPKAINENHPAPTSKKYKINATYIGINYNVTEIPKSFKDVIQALKSPDEIQALFDAATRLNESTIIKDEESKNRLIKRFVKCGALKGDANFINELGNYYSLTGKTEKRFKCYHAAAGLSIL